jgi:hypothetical protein
LSQYVLRRARADSSDVDAAFWVDVLEAYQDRRTAIIATPTIESADQAISRHVGGRLDR